jgi:hypothetical protein
MGKKLPKTIFVQWDEGSGQPGDGFFKMEGEAGDLATPNATTVAGLYELVKTVEIKNTTEVVYKKSPAKKS